MAGINSYANLTLKGDLAFGKQVAEFPANPSLGLTCFKDGVLFIYASINNFNTWYPLNRPQSSYVHSQGIPALQWTLNHGLGTTDIVVAVYDEQGRAQNCGIQTRYIPENPAGQQYQAVLTFTEAMAGTAVVFGKESISAPSVQAETINAQAITVNNVPVTTEADLTASLDGMAGTFQQYT